VAVLGSVAPLEGDRRLRVREPVQENLHEAGADPVALAAGEKEWRLFAPVLDAQLASRKWILGNDLTLADFSVGACFSYAEPSGLPMGDYGHIQAWLSRLGEIPAWRNTAPKLG
jgi:glutathione S-transferase